MMMQLRKVCAGILLFLPTLSGCGGKVRTQGGGSIAKGAIQRAFSSAAAKYGVPERLLIATANLESEINPFPIQAAYLDERISVWPAQTAFGISREELGISNHPDANNLTVQIDAYGAWLAKRVEDLGLKPNPVSMMDKFNWIWQIARQHRQSRAGTDNVRVVFSRELMQTLNNGLTWQGGTEQETLKLSPENPPLPTDKFDHKPELRDAKVFSARYLRMFGGDVSDPKIQEPRGVDIVHCPMALSACLEMQGTALGSGSVQLGAHYIVPQDDLISSFPLQLKDHREALPRTLEDGSIGYSNRVVIMLTGRSGRVIDGKRAVARPDWLSHWQLAKLGQLIFEVCADLAAKSEGEPNELTLTDCKTEGKGLFFQQPEGDGLVRWGDIADFDRELFMAYIDAPGELSNDTQFYFANEQQTFPAGEIPLELRFALNVRYLELEHLIRCEGSSKVAWHPVLSFGLRAKNFFKISLPFYDPGPNLTGTHFFRAKVYGEKKELLGWDLTKVTLTSYDDTAEVLSEAECRE